MKKNINLMNIDVRDFLDDLEIENIMDEGPEVRFSCPYPDHANGDRNPSCYMNNSDIPEKHGIFFCQGCKTSGDMIDMTVYVLEVSRLEAVRLLKEGYEPGYVNPDERATRDEVRDIMATRQRAPKTQPVLDEYVLTEFAVDWHAADEAEVGHPATDYILERGFSAETLTHWNFGYDEHSDRITFAVRDERNRLVGFKGRAYDGHHPKYIVLGDKPERPPRYGFPCYRTGQVVFGLVEATELSDEAYGRASRRLIVCEGELNAIACWQAGYAAVALNGSNFTEYQEKVMRFHADEVTLFLDSDKAGTEAVRGWRNKRGEWQPGMVERLKDFMIVKTVPEHEGDPASMEEDEIADLLARARGAVTTLIR